MLRLVIEDTSLNLLFHRSNQFLGGFMKFQVKGVNDMGKRFLTLDNIGDFTFQLSTSDYSYRIYKAFYRKGMQISGAHLLEK